KTFLAVVVCIGALVCWPGKATCSCHPIHCQNFPFSPTSSAFTLALGASWWASPPHSYFDHLSTAPSPNCPCATFCRATLHLAQSFCLSAPRITVRHTITSIFKESTRR